MKKWLIGTGGLTIASVLASVITDFINNRQVFSTIISIVETAWNFQARVSWVLFAILIVKVVIILIKNRKANQLYNDYTKDTIHGWTWKWWWAGGLVFLREIEGLMVICPNCETQLTNKHQVSHNSTTNLLTLGDRIVFFNHNFHHDDRTAGPGYMCVRCGYGKPATQIPKLHDIKVWIWAEIDERKKQMHAYQKKKS